MGYANPVPGRIQAKSEPWDKRSFRQVRTFADHIAAGDAPGVDIGNAREGDPVLAAADGTISQAFTDSGNGAKIVRQKVTGSLDILGYAHLRTIGVAVNQKVSRGQQLGTVGSTGAPGQPHLHWGVNRNNKEIDGWPLLDQNQLPNTGAGGPDVPSPMKVYTPYQITLGGLQMWLVGGLVPVYDAPNRSAGVVYKLTPGVGTLFSPGTVPGAPEEFYTYWDVPKGRWLYIYKQNVTMAQPLTAGSGGFTQAQLNAAAQKAAGSVAAAATTEAKKYP